MTDTLIRTELDDDGILLATIDMPGRAMNVFSRELMDELDALLTRVEADAAIRGAVLTSGKNNFLAGADLDMIRMFTERARTGTTAELHELFGYLGRVFRRLEQSSKPYVAAINGLALGGGLEVAMACHARVTTDDAQLGLPEIKLGLLPGAGGTQRLPRLIGTAKGLEMLLTGDPVGAQEALSLGLINDVVPSNQLITAARMRAASLSAPLAPWDRPGARFDASPFDFSGADAAERIAAVVGISDYQREHYPAYNAIIDCVIGGWHLPMTEACRREMDIFVELMRDPVAGNMVRALFLNRQKAVKLGLLNTDSVYTNDNDALLPVVRAAREQANALECDEQESMLAVTLAALRVWEAGKVEQPSLADAAIVHAGLAPPYTGGPYTYALQLGAPAVRQRADLAARLSSTLFAVPNTLESFIASVA